MSEAHLFNIETGVLSITGEYKNNTCLKACRFTIGRLLFSMGRLLFSTGKTHHDERLYIAWSTKILRRTLTITLSHSYGVYSSAFFDSHYKKMRRELTTA